jgi:hypothetical protein
MGRLGNGAKLEPNTLLENHEPGGRETAICPWDVLSGIVLGGGESPPHGEGPDGSTPPVKETRAGHGGLDKHEPTRLAGNSKSSKRKQRPSFSESISMPECRIVAGVLARPEQGRGQRRGWSHGGTVAGKPGGEYSGLGSETENRGLSCQTGTTLLYTEGQWERKAAGHSRVGGQTRTTRLRKVAECHL